jgi:phage baseplate assembly protein W
VVEQDSVEEIMQNVSVILQTRVGTRIEIPDFGTDTLLFTIAGGSDLDTAVAQVAEWEPRAVIAFQEWPDRMDDLVRRVRLEVSRSNEGGQ